MTARVFIDGEAGTTGLQIRERLEGRRDVSLISLSQQNRKDAEHRRRALNDADLVILCLPDDAAREAVSMIENDTTRVIDASTAHRVADGWTYGFPEMTRDQADAVRAARFVANPGCYPTGGIAVIRPLVDAGIVPTDFPVTVNAVSGYSGGGKSLIAAFEDAEAENRTNAAYYGYGLTLQHKHVPELHTYTHLAHPPIFTPAVGRYYKGMLVQVPLQLWALPGSPSPADLHACLAERYAGQTFVRVAPLAESAGAAKMLDPEALNGSNDMVLHVFANEKSRQVVLAAVLDNLGKGASGAAVQNMNLMLGLDASSGLAPKLAA